MKLKFKVLKTLASVDLLIYKTVSHYDLPRRVCLKMCVLHSSQCVLSLALRPFTVRNTPYQALYWCTVRNFNCAGNWPWLPCLLRQSPEKQRELTCQDSHNHLVTGLTHNVLPVLPELPCFWVTLSPSLRDYLPQERPIMKERGAQSTSPASTLKPGSIRQTVGILCRH